MCNNIITVITRCRLAGEGRKRRKGKEKCLRHSGHSC